MGGGGLRHLTKGQEGSRNVNPQTGPGGLIRGTRQETCLEIGKRSRANKAFVRGCQKTWQGPGKGVTTTLGEVTSHPCTEHQKLRRQGREKKKGTTMTFPPKTGCNPGP